MIVVGLGTGSTTTTAVALTKTLMTNDNVSLSGNVLSVLVPGIYEVVGEATITSSASDDTGLALYVDGTSSVSGVFESTGSGETNSVVIYDVIDVTSATNGYVELTIMPVNAPTIVSGSVSVKRLV